MCFYDFIQFLDFNLQTQIRRETVGNYNQSETGIKSSVIAKEEVLVCK